MKKLILILFLCSTQIFSFSQGLQINPSAILFENTNELTTKNTSFTIHNTSETDIRIKNVVCYKTYSENIFSIKINAADSILNPDDSIQVDLSFSPQHNIFHNSEILVITEPNAYSFSIDVRGQGTFSNTYYAATQNLSEDALKSALKTITGQGYVSLGYTPARNFMFMNIDNKKVNGQGAAQNTLECIYTGREAVGYSDRTDAQTSDTFDTEHTFPQGFFSQNEPMRSDLHHLFPTYSPSNNSRGNFPFGIATQPYKNDDRNYPSHLGANNVYEPHNVQKGSTARAMMYFVIRYTDYTNFFASQETILRNWHKQFKPDSIEQKRNTDIAFYQKNRNPFVDYPQFIERIQKIVGSSTAPVTTSFEFSDSVSFGSIASNTTPLLLSIPIVNTGTENISLSNFHLSDTNLTFALQGTMDTTLSAGDAYHLKVKVNRSEQAAINSTVTFNSSLGAKSILINGSVNKVSGFTFNKNSQYLKIFPNPGQGIYFIKSNEQINASEILVYTILGNRKSALINQLDANTCIVNLIHFDKGIYFIRYRNLVYKLIKE